MTNLIAFFGLHNMGNGQHESRWAVCRFVSEVGVCRTKLDRIFLLDTFVIKCTSSINS